MAVFWFGWTKKLKNIFTKKEADTYYLQKELPNQLQIVKGNVDFYKNVVVKQNGYVDRVDTNAPTSMINKRYLDNAINSIQVGRSIKLGNYIYKTESKNINGGNTPTQYSSASGFSVSNLEVGKLYLVEVRYLSGTYERAPIFYEGTNTSNIYITYADAVVMFSRNGNLGLTVYANKPINNLSISFKEVIITN